MIVYIENPVVSTKKLLDLTSEFGKIVGYKVNIQNQMHFCTPTMKYQKQKSRKTSYLLGINLTAEVKDLYSENYTTLKKEIKEDTNK